MLKKQAISIPFIIRSFSYVLLFFLIFSNARLTAQQTHTDSLAAEEEDLFALPEDSLSYNNDFIPEDIIFIPSDVLYNNSWDNVNVRLKKEDLAQMEDTVDIILNHPSESSFIFPRPGKFLSPFGYRGRHFHAGVDIKLNLGDSILSAWDGKVRLSKRYRGYGNIVVIRHFNGLETVYSHLSKLLVEVNQDVKAGDLIGLGGQTGRATTSHLHFETRFLGEPFNPETFIDFNTFRVKNDTLSICGSLFERGKGTKASTTGKKHKSSSSSHSASHYYTVRKGDTLSKIAQKNGTTIKNLCRLNKITTRTVLKPGRRLKLK